MLSGARGGRAPVSVVTSLIESWAVRFEADYILDHGVEEFLLLRGRNFLVALHDSRGTHRPPVGVSHSHYDHQEIVAPVPYANDSRFGRDFVIHPGRLFPGAKPGRVALDPRDAVPGP